MTAPIGVLVMAHGTPGRAEEIAPFYTRIRRGRPPTDEQLAELVGRYEAIGGLSPLTERTQAQVDGLRAALEARAPGRYVVAYGSKHAAPLIEDGAAALLDAGVSGVVGLVLTPHQSTMGSGEYLERARAAIGEVRPLVEVPSWYAAPGLVSVLAERVRQAVAAVTTDGDRPCTVIFTAHSLPERIRQLGDPYPDQLDASAGLVAEAAGVTTWSVAWQSAGRTPDPWLGPDVRDVITELGAAGDVAVVVCPIGFVSDHLEVLYDLDIEAAAVAAQAGVTFTRTASLNDDPRFMRALAEVVEQAAVGLP
jgi:ferrochelatase